MNDDIITTMDIPCFVNKSEFYQLFNHSKEYQSLKHDNTMYKVKCYFEEK